jgi:hypothetical protein
MYREQSRNNDMTTITVTQPGDIDADPPPDVTPYFGSPEFRARLEAAAADLGLPPEPWPLPRRCPPLRLTAEQWARYRADRDEQAALRGLPPLPR